MGSVKKPSDGTIRKALLRWTKAQLRWAEVALGPGFDRKEVPAKEAAARKQERLTAECALLALGMKLLVTTPKQRKVKP
jgi:hypothetical protein